VIEEKSKQIEDGEDEDNVDNYNVDDIELNCL
jgi:hypothetical protein